MLGDPNRSPVFLRVRWRGQGASFRQIQQRYEPHAGTLRAIEIVENSPTYSERPQPTAHASRDHGDKRNYTKAFKETSRRRKVGFSDLSMEILFTKIILPLLVLRYYGIVVSC